MKLFFALLLIIFLVFSGYHLTFRGFKLPLSARQFYLTGSEFLFLGLFLGPAFTNILDHQTLIQLEPLIALILGWTGLIFGFQFEIKGLKRFPLDFLSAALLEGAVTLLVVFCGVYFMLPLFFVIDQSLQISIALALAAAASCTAQTGLALLTPKSVVQFHKIIRLLRYISSIDGLIAMIILCFVFFFGAGMDRKAIDEGLLLTGVFAGLFVLYSFFLARKLEKNELLLVVIGMAVLASGTAAILLFSPLLINFLLGVGLVNLSQAKERVYAFLATVEKPVYLLLLVFLGANWHVTSKWIFIAALAYSLIRCSGKLVAGSLIRWLLPNLKSHTVPFMGFALIEQGGVTLAILLDFHQGFYGPITHQVLGMALITVIYHDLVSPHLLQKMVTVPGNRTTQSAEETP